MSIERPKSEARLEHPHALEVNVVSLNYCKTVDEMLERIEAAKRERPIDTVLLGEYDFKVEEVLGGLEKIKETAVGNQADIILAPDNEFGKNLTWGELKTELERHTITVEETTMPDNHKPETVGIFVRKDGFVYAFPKTWHLKEVHRPVHKMPDTSVGITICGEIHDIKADDLEGISILYNPSREGDDPYLKFRMLHRHGTEPLTRESVAKVLMDDDYYKNMLDDTQYDPSNPLYEPEYDEREVRERRFNEAVEAHLSAAQNPANSRYVEKIAQVLNEKRIPVVRTDGERTTGVLNQVPDMKIEDLEYRDGFARYKVALEKK